MAVAVEAGMLVADDPTGERSFSAASAKSTTSCMAR
jgi:hypothetical protein